MNARFTPDTPVRVKALYPPGHVRTPYFVRGRRGHIAEVAGAFGDPERLAYGDRAAAPATLYRVRFDQTELWSPYDGPPGDTVMVDIYETWLEPAPEPRP